MIKKLINSTLKILGLEKIIGEKIHLYKVNKSIKNKNVEERFTSIYNDGIWFSNKESASGTGSTLEVTKKVREWLPEIIKELEIKTLVDMGCGDFNWMKEVKLECNYIGTDIVKSVIDNNILNYKKHNIDFIHHNAIEQKTPNADAVICRDVLFHLSFNDCFSVLKNIQQSSAKYLITTSFKGIDLNKDIYSGHFRKISLENEPYNFPPPIHVIFESEEFNDRYLGVWDLSKMRNFN